MLTLSSAALTFTAVSGGTAPASQTLTFNQAVDASTLSLTKLMGKGEAQARRELMELRGDAVEVDV